MPTQSTILIVDDEPFGREMLRALLNQRGYTLYVAASGEEALALAKASAPDLVLLDIMMPDMDGYEVCERMRRDPRLVDIPIVMVTALEDRHSRLRGIQAGADDFVSKPFDREELRAKVRTTLRLNRFRRIQAERIKFEWVVEHSDQGYLILDESDHIQYMNAQARLILGDDGVTKPVDLPTFTELVRGKYNREPAAAWANWPRPASPEPGGMKRYLVRPESETTVAYWLSVDVVALPPGSGTGILVRLNNISAQVDVMREQRTFHALIQHRLRTPVSLMLGSLDVLALEHDETSDLHELVHMARRGAKRIHQDIEEILAYLKAPGPQTGVTGMGLADLPDLIALCAQRVKLDRVTTVMPTWIGMGPAAASATALVDGTLNEEMTENLAARIVLGQRFMELILVELLQNARKFHLDRDPTVEVEVTLDGILDGARFAHLFVRDNGVQLNPDQIGQVWTPYFQGEKGFSGQIEGWGLGLSTVASMVWGVGGTCRLGNRADQVGVEVELTLPVV